MQNFALLHGLWQEWPSMQKLNSYLFFSYAWQMKFSASYLFKKMSNLQLKDTQMDAPINKLLK